jgi:hypothetical protein
MTDRGARAEAEATHKPAYPNRLEDTDKFRGVARNFDL